MQSQLFGCNSYRGFYSLFFIFLAFIFSLQNSDAQVEDSSMSKHAVVLSAAGAIGPAVADYLVRGIEQAEISGAEVVVYQMDTPGGLDSAMRDIIQAILNSPVPVVTFVAPDGARAASAGTYILYASHVAAMSPATNLGAATPIQIGGFPGAPESPDSDGQKEEPVASQEAPKSTLERKIVNDASAYIKSLAERHGRNAEWAERAVREAVSLSASEALELGVVDVVAANLQELLKAIDGREVKLATGSAVLSTADIAITPVEQTWKDRVLAIISDPNIAYILLLLGVYGLIFELMNPGTILPGVAGGIALILALYAFQVLPINYSGLALIVLGIFFIVGEAFMPSFGVLGFGGVVAFAVGSFILVDEEDMRISFSIIAGTSIVSATFILWVAGRLVAMRGQKVRTGAEAIIGMTGEVIDDFEDSGRIWLQGESWQVKTEGRLKKGDRVKVTGKNGLELNVTTLEGDTQ